MNFIKDLLFMKYIKKPNINFLLKYKDELADQKGNDQRNRIISFKGKYWYVKTINDNSKKKNFDLLSYKLGKGWLNTPEVMLLTDSQRRILSKKLFGEEENIYLIRLAQDYSAKDLPIKNFTEAIASEIVFSIWIMRRDAHNSNRTIINGKIPIFFDMEVGFRRLDKKNEVMYDRFFQGGKDHGYVANWRLYYLNGLDHIHIKKLREMEFNKPLTLHPIESTEKFWRSVEFFRNKIENFSNDHLMELVYQSGLDGDTALKVHQRLIYSKNRLGESINHIKPILESPSNNNEKLEKQNSLLQGVH